MRENIPALYTEGLLASNYRKQQSTIQQIVTGERINSSADDAAGLSLVDRLKASSLALAQSESNAVEGVDLLQVADQTLAQVTNMLTRAITLSTEASNGTLNGAQESAANSEYQQILQEIDKLGTNTSYNTIQIFSGNAAGIDIFTTFGTYSAGSGQITNVVFDKLASNSVGSVDLSTTDLLTQTNAQQALTSVTKAVSSVAAQRGYLGAKMNTLDATHSVLQTGVANLERAQDTVEATDFGSATSDMSKYQILCQSAVSALAQCNNIRKQVANLLTQ